MAQRERAVNDNLKALGDAHRLGRMSREEYRARRRHLLIGLSESDSATARNPITPRAAETIAPAFAPASSVPITAAPPRIRPAVLPETPVAAGRSGGALLWILLGLVVAGLAGAAFWFLGMPEGRSVTTPAAAQKAPAGNGDAAAALEARAASFVEDNRWEPQDISAFLGVWSTADEKARAAALSHPALTRLREQIANNLRVTRLLLEDAAPGSDRAEQVKALEEFDQVLGGVP